MIGNQIIGLLIAFILGILVMYFYRRSQCPIFSPNDLLFQHIRVIYRQMARYLRGAVNDRDLIIAYAHMSYGMGYLWAIEEMATADQITEAIGINHMDVKKEAIAIQDQIIKQVINVCPKLTSNGSLLAKIALSGGNPPP